MTWFRKGLRCATSTTATRHSRTARSRASSSLRSEFRIKEQAMTTITKGDTIKTITTHYIDGVFVESHGREVMDMIKPTNGQVIARVTLADEEDTRHAIAAAKSAFASFGRSTKFVKPTVFVNVKNNTTIAQEEIFGPVLSVIAYDSEDEAIRIANDSEYGLHAAVLGKDLSRARRVASQLQAGRVVINGMTDDPQAPWGGFKYSGVGREYG